MANTVVFPFFQKITSWLRPKPKTQTPPRPDQRVIAVRDLRDRWSTNSLLDLTPETLLSLLESGTSGDMRLLMELFEDIEERDAHIASVFQTRKLSVLQLKRVVLPYTTEENEEGKRARELAEFVEHAIERIMNFHDSLFDILDCIGKGYSVSEINWMVEDGKVLVDSIDWIHPKRITFSDSFEPMLLTDEEPWRGVAFPPWKIIYMVHHVRSGWDTRAGLLRTVALLFLLKRYALKDWAAYNEIFGMPLRLGKYDPAASQADREALFQAVQALGSDAAGIISKATEIEFIQATGGSGKENPFLLMQQYCNSEISKAVLGQTLTTDTAGATGTYSAGKVHEGVRQDLLRADGQALGEALTKQLVFPLVGFNFGWDVAKTLCPYIQFQLQEEVDLREMSVAYKNLLDAGVPISLDYINEVFSLPEIGNDDKFVGGEKVHVSANQKQEEGETQEQETEEEETKASSSAVESFMRRNPPKLVKDSLLSQAVLDGLVGQAVPMVAEVGRLILKPVEDLIARGSSLDSIKEKLTSVYGEIEPDRLADILYMVMMMSYLQAYEEETTK